MSEMWITDCQGKRRRAKKSICQQCSQEFLQRVSGTKKLCSLKCKHSALENKIELTCTNCKCKFLRKPSANKSKYGFPFCSVDCLNKARVITSGIDMVRPSHYGQNESIYTYRLLCKDGLEKGCTCGEKRIYLLQVHHIDGSRTNNKRENLEVVCANCHVLRHMHVLDGQWVYSPKSLTPRDILDKL